MIVIIFIAAIVIEGLYKQIFELIARDLNNKSILLLYLSGYS